jgi:hypothetical protein
MSFELVPWQGPQMEWKLYLSRGSGPILHNQPKNPTLLSGISEREPVADPFTLFNRMYDVFWPLELSSKCYLATIIAILAFLMWPNIILEFNRYIL